MPTVTGPVVPTSSAIPGVDANAVAGGVHSYATLAERDAIHANRLKAGMLCFVVATGRTYQLSDDLETWSELGGYLRPGPEMFGGVADGVIDANGHVTGTDCTAAIQECLDTFGSVYFAKGTYVVGGHVNVPASASVVGAGKELTILAKPDAAVPHASLYGWGTYHPDSFLTGNSSDWAFISGITFDCNGANRSVTGMAGYTQPGTNAIMVFGKQVTVSDCQFKRFGAFSGSTSGSRTPGLPETWVVNLGVPPGNSQITPFSSSWSYYPGPRVIGCIFSDAVPQVDPNDFSSAGMTPEISLVGISGMAATWHYGSGISVSGTTITSSSAFFESWMTGDVAYLGPGFERAKIASVTSPTQATLSGAPVGTFSNSSIKILKRTRVLLEAPEVSCCLFKNLRIWRTSDTDKQLRSIHMVSLSDHTAGIVKGNQAERCDGIFYYQDNGVCFGITIEGNTLQEVTHGVIVGTGPAMVDPVTAIGNGFWFRDTRVAGNTWRHGNGRMSVLYNVYIDKAASDNDCRVFNKLPSCTSGVVLETAYTLQNIDDYYWPSTDGGPEQGVVVDNFQVVNNDIQYLGDFYSRGVFYTAAWDSDYSVRDLIVTDNVLDGWGTYDESKLWYSLSSVDGALLRCYSFSPSVYKHGGNHASNGSPVPWYSDYDSTNYYSETDGPRIVAGSNVTLTSLNGVTTISATGGGGGAPSAHASTHAAAGSDPLTLSISQVSGLSSSLSGKQALDAELTALSGVTSAADALPYFTGSGTASTTTLTSFGRTLLDDTDAATALTTIGAAASTHASTHSAAGSDPVTLTTAQVTGLDSALASAGAETPTWSNHFTTDATGVAAYNAGTVSAVSGSAVTVGNGTGGQRGASLGNFTPSIGTEYLLTIYVDTAPSVGWDVFSKTTFSATYKLATITAAGWYTWRFTTDGASKPLVVAVSGAAASSTISLGYAAIYTSPSPALHLAAGDGNTAAALATLTSGKVDVTSTAVAIGSAQRPPASAGVPTQNQYSVAVGPLALSDSVGVAVGYNAIHASGTSGTGGVYGHTLSAGAENISIGAYSFASSWRDTAVGDHALAMSVSTAAYGFYTYNGIPHSIVMGRMGSIPANYPYATGESSIFCAEPYDVYFGGGSVSVMANPCDADNYTLGADDRGSALPVRRVKMHGPDAFDARTGGTTAASTQYADTTARDAIAVTSRWPGMIVYVTGTQKSYLLNADFSVSTIKRIAQYERSGTTVTLTFRDAHGMVAGNTVTVWGCLNATLNGTYTVDSAPTSTTLTFTHGTSGTIAATNDTTGMGMKNTLADNSLWLDLSTSWAKTPTYRCRVSNVATLRFASAHQLSVGNTITVSGMTDSSYNATGATITSVTPYSTNLYELSYSNTGSDEGSRASMVSNAAGTVTPLDVRSLNQPGRDISLCGGRSTGSGTPGRVVIETAPLASAGGNVKNTLVESAYFDSLVDAVNNKSRFLLLDTAAGTYRRVEFGAADSGGTGYRMVRVAN